MISNLWKNPKKKRHFWLADKIVMFITCILLCKSKNCELVDFLLTGQLCRHQSFMIWNRSEKSLARNHATMIFFWKMSFVLYLPLLRNFKNTCYWTFQICIQLCPFWLWKNEIWYFVSFVILEAFACGTQNSRYVFLFRTLTSNFWTFWF